MTRGGAAGAGALAVTAGLLLYLFPRFDLWVTGFFYDGTAFPWNAAYYPELMHSIIQPSGWITFYALALAFALSLFRLGDVLGLNRRAWFFLAISLAIGPGLMANAVLKDNWGRARPKQVQEFGGTRRFTPPLQMASQCDRNCAFVAGDPAMAFWLHSFAYVIGRRRRLLFWGAMAAGAGTGVLRIGMGAHFFSDVYFSGLFMLASSAGLYLLMYGRSALAGRWREWLFGIRPATG